MLHDHPMVQQIERTGYPNWQWQKEKSVEEEREEEE